MNPFAVTLIVLALVLLAASLVARWRFLALRARIRRRALKPRPVRELMSKLREHAVRDRYETISLITAWVGFSAAVSACAIQLGGMP